MTETTLTARGGGSAVARGDRLVLTLMCSATESDPEGALSQVNESWRKVRAILDDLDIPEADRLNAAATVQPHREFEQKRWIDKGWRAVCRVRLRLPKGEKGSELVSRAAVEAEASIQASQWEVLPGNPARTEAVEEAVANAQERARALANAAGLQLGALLMIRDLPEDRFAAMSAGGRGPAPEIGEGWVDVNAIVELEYSAQ